jgi:regulatory protein
MTDPAPVMEAAAAFLTVRPRSVVETSRRLKYLGYPAALVGQVVGQLIDLGYLDDEAFARTWVESRDRARPRGTAALRRELALKGVEREVVAEVLADRDQVIDASAESADMTAALRLMERRRSALEREPDLRKRRQKAYALLARHGFDPDVCSQVASLLISPSQ